MLSVLVGCGGSGGNVFIPDTGSLPPAELPLPPSTPAPDEATPEETQPASEQPEETTGTLTASNPPSEPNTPDTPSYPSNNQQDDSSPPQSASDPPEGPGDDPGDIPPPEIVEVVEVPDEEPVPEPPLQFDFSHDTSGYEISNKTWTFQAAPGTDQPATHDHTGLWGVNSAGNTLFVARYSDELHPSVTSLVFRGQFTHEWIESPGATVGSPFTATYEGRIVGLRASNDQAFSGDITATYKYWTANAMKHATVSAEADNISGASFTSGKTMSWSNAPMAPTGISPGGTFGAYFFGRGDDKHNMMSGWVKNDTTNDVSRAVWGAIRH